MRTVVRSARRVGDRGLIRHVAGGMPVTPFTGLLIWFRSETVARYFFIPGALKVMVYSPANSPGIEEKPAPLAVVSI